MATQSGIPESLFWQISSLIILVSEFIDREVLYIGLEPFDLDQEGAQDTMSPQNPDDDDDDETVGHLQDKACGCMTKGDRRDSYNKI